MVEQLKKQSKPTTTSKEIAQVGTISANSDESIGKIIAEAMDKVGKEGVITVEDGKSLDNELDVVEGMQFDRGYLSPYFINNPEKQRRRSSRTRSCCCTTRRSATSATCCRLLEQVAKAGQPLLIVAEEVEGEALATLVVNTIRGILKVVRRQGAGLRRPPQGHAGRHRHPDRRQGHRRGVWASRSRRSRWPTWARPSASRWTRRTPRSSTAPASRGRHRGARQADPRADRGSDQRLRPREAAGARGQAGRRRGGDQGRRGDRESR